MSKVTTTEASKLTGKSRATLYNAMKSGSLSYVQDDKDGRLLDTEELLRVYGPLKPLDNNPVQPDVKALHHQTPVDGDLVAVLKAQLAEAAERERWLRDQLDAVLQRALPPAAPRPWWKVWR